jgi:hypothetical protein
MGKAKKDCKLRFGLVPGKTCMLEETSNRHTDMWFWSSAEES